MDLDVPDYLIMKQRSNGGWYGWNYLLDRDLPSGLCLDHLRVRLRLQLAREF